MLRNRSPRAVSSKKPVMADHHPSSPSSSSSSSSSSPTQTPTFFGSPRLFRAFTHSEADHNSLISPTSILDTSHTTKPFPFVNPFSYDNKSSQPTTPKAVPGNKRLWEKPEAKGIGLALLDTLSEEKQEENNTSKASNGKVLFGTKLIPPPFPAETLNSPLSAKGSANSSNQTESYNSNSPQGFTVSEMELSEDYTCVIARGPNPRTTHIFDNCIVESYYTLSDHSNSPSADFLSFCHTCKKYLEQKNDIFIYTGEKAFCSRECRYQEMLIDEVGNKEYDDAMRSCS